MGSFNDLDILMISFDFQPQPLHWLATRLLPSDHTLLVLTTWLTGISLVWLLYRTWLVLRIPLPELVDILGLEVPHAPHVSLAGIESDSITLHWTRPDTGSTVVKYLIQVNGILVGESSRSETAITVSGLNPGHFYGVRVIASAANNYQTASSVIRLKTLDKDGASGEVYKPTAALVRSSSLHANNTTSAVEARGDHHGSRAHGLLQDHPSAATSTGKEKSSVGQHGRRSTTNQRGHPPHLAASSSTGSPSTSRHGEPQIPASVSDLSIEQLTEKLDAIRRDIEDTQLQKVKEEEEFQSTKAALSQERDRLKQLLKEKEDASAELKREVAGLERQNRVAQGNKTAKEKLLRQKQDERKKLQVDIERWDREAEGYRRDIEKMKKQKRKLVENTDKEVLVVRQRIGQWQSSIKEMEEDIRRKGAYIKEVEDKRRKLRAEENEAEAKGRVKVAKEQDAKWDTKLRDLQAVYTKTLNALQHAQENYRRAQERLAYWRSQGVSSPAEALTLTSPEPESLMNAKAKQRKGRQTKSRTFTKSYSINGYPVEPRSQASSFSSISPFFTPQNLALSQRPSGMTGLSADDMEQLTAGASMSPTADSLLPSDLLGDEDIPSHRVGSLGASLAASRSSDSNAAPKFGTGHHDSLVYVSQSPVSAGSRAPSGLSSPITSAPFLSAHKDLDPSVGSGRFPQNVFDGSFGASRSQTDPVPTSPRKLTSIFGLNLSRQRGKTLDAQPPALGSLKSSQTQSFPRDWDQPPSSLDPIGTKRRRGSYSTSWIGPMSSFNFRGRPGTRGGADAAADAEESAGKENSPRRMPFNMFGSKYALLNLPSLPTDTSPPRPSSMSSGDHALPRPSSESQPFGWPAQRSNALPGLDWSFPATGEMWSQGLSRRSSVKHGSTSSLSLGIGPSSDLDMVAGIGALSKQQLSHQAPIGTRPPSSSQKPQQQQQRPDPPRLNPAAPSFKTIFGGSRKETKKWGSKADKHDHQAAAAAAAAATAAAAAEREHEREWEKERERERDRDFEAINEEVSSGLQRKSRDSRSVHTETEDSAAESRDSLDRSEAATASDSGHAAAAGTAKDKESILQKISRKSSANKFNVPWKDKNVRSGKKSATEAAAAAGDVEDEGSAESQLGKSMDSVASSSGPGASASAGAVSGQKNNSLSWTSLRRKSRKGERTMAAVAAAAASGGDDDTAEGDD